MSRRVALSAPTVVAIALGATLGAAPPAAAADPAAPPVASAGAPASPAPASPAPASPAPASPAPASPSAATDVAPTAPAATTNALPLAPPPKDELVNPGYIPGYRLDRELGMSPYVPSVGALPGGTTPGFHAPSPATEWSFRWTGFLTISGQYSINHREAPLDGQSKIVFHTPPRTIDEYASFVGTTTIPGQWVQMNFAYGNPYVTANVSLTTWNPSDPTTYYQIGSQQFVNNAYLAFELPMIADIKPRASVGYFSATYGNLGQYGPGMYTNAIAGLVRGVGENIVLSYDVNESTTVTLEDGFVGTRNGTPAINVVPSGQNGTGNPRWPSAWVHHAHLGIEKRGDITLRARLHYFSNWSQEDRSQLPFDNPTTRALDEAYYKDGSIKTYALDLGVSSSIWGYLGTSAAYVRGQDAYAIKGDTTFGGDGEALTNRWWGQTTGGTGQLLVAGVNYGASLGRIISYPVPFSGNGPDLALNAGFIIAKTWSDVDLFDRVRHKYGLDALYTFLPNMGAGLRVDRVVPTSKDSDETFHVVAARLVFKSDWQSRDTVTVSYAKWFYGSHSHPEASSLAPGVRLDDQLFAVNVQMWW